MYEFIGKVKTVGELQTFASGFTKRELVVEEEREGKWPNVVAFAFKKDNVAKLDGVKPGMRVKVGFAVDGREWTDPKTGKVRYFSDLTALRLEQLDGALQVPESTAPCRFLSRRTRTACRQNPTPANCRSEICAKLQSIVRFRRGE